jgi:hypothetical protein
LQAAEKDAADASTKRSHDEGAASLNANQVLMLHNRLKIIQARAAQARARSDADAGDAHEIHAEVDNWAKRPFSCWCHTCSRVRGRGLGSQSSGPDLLVSGCTSSNQTVGQKTSSQ